MSVDLESSDQGCGASGEKVQALTGIGQARFGLVPPGAGDLWQRQEPYLVGQGQEDGPVTVGDLHES